MILKYLRLYKSFFKASFVADLEFRANFFGRIVIDIFWYLAQIITFETLFQHTDRIGSWNLPQTRVFLGVLFVTDAIYMIMFSDNLERMGERVRKGELDLLLAKPVNSQFMVSLQRANTAIFGNLILAISWLAWSLYGLQGAEASQQIVESGTQLSATAGAIYQDFNWFRLLWLIYLIPMGLISLYAIRFMIASASLIFTQSDNLHFLWYQVYKLGMRPDSLYLPWLRAIIITALPVALIASVPASSILDEPRLLVFAWAGVLASFFLWMSARFWRYCLKKYSSASS